MQIEVKGHSGCAINIVRENHQLFIDKSTHDPKYVARLHQQALKQQQAAETKYQYIRIPKIFSIDRTESSLSMRMEYVYSKNFIVYLEQAGFEKVQYFIKAMKIFLDSEIALSPMTQISTKDMMDKFQSVKSIVFNNDKLREDAEVVEIMNRSEVVFENMPNTIEIPVGKCHGDLTMSNILFNGNNYYLIDFLDSFIETPLMDMVKLRQDTAYTWSTLMFSGRYDETRLSIIFKKIDTELNDYFMQYEWYRQYYHPFQLMNFLRILQYAKEDKVISYLKCVITNLLR